MGFGKRASKVNTPKKVVTKQDVFRDNTIIEHIMYYIENTDAGCVDIHRIKERLSGVENIDKYIERCIEKYGYIKHRGWVYGKLWDINDVKSISCDIVNVDNFDNYNMKNSEELMKFLRNINKGNGIKIQFLESLCLEGVGIMKMTEKDMYASLGRLIQEGRIYEPVIGTFVPLDFKN